MATLIGDSGHARDIWETLPNRGYWRRVGHHKNFDHTDSVIIIGINDPAVRATVCNELNLLDRKWTHPNAYFGPDCSIGAGTHVNYGASMTRTTLGRHVTIGPGVVIGGDVTIGDRVFVGMGALIGVKHPGETVIIGDDVTIGAGAVVLHDIPEGTWVGNPARRIR